MHKLNIGQHHRLPETRERGRSFYTTLLEWAQKASEDEILVLSFEDVEFVSPSFIDETIVRLVEEHPSLTDRLRLATVDAFTFRTIRSTLRARDIESEIPVYEPA